MGLALGTQELANEIWRLQEAGDPAFIAAIEGLSIKLLFVGTDCPGNEDRQLALDIDDGRFLEIGVSTKPAPSDLRTAPVDHTKYEFRVLAPQQILVDMVNGDIEVLDVLGQIKLEGDFGRFMAQVQGFMRFIEFLGTMGIVP
jgi:hypothetical protein